MKIVMMMMFCICFMCGKRIDDLNLKLYHITQMWWEESVGGVQIDEVDDDDT